MFTSGCTLWTKVVMELLKAQVKFVMELRKTLIYSQRTREASCDVKLSLSGD